MVTPHVISLTLVAVDRYAFGTCLMRKPTRAPGGDRWDGIDHDAGGQGWWVAGGGPGELEEGPVVAVDVAVGVQVGPSAAGEHERVGHAFVEEVEVVIIYRTVGIKVPAAVNGLFTPTNVVPLRGSMSRT